MKDLKISYSNENGEIIKQEYNTIMDFLDLMKSDNIDIPMLDYEDVNAVFFENKLNTKDFDIIEDLVKYCITITR